jgi:membrane protease YdiL (CAAX protease family)
LLWKGKPKARCSPKNFSNDIIKFRIITKTADGDIKLDDQVNLKNFWVFIISTFTFSWLMWIPSALFGENFTSSPWGIPYLLGGFGPSLAAIWLVYRGRSPETKREFWKRLYSIDRIPGGTYLLIFLIIPLVYALSLLLHRLLGGELPKLNTISLIAEQPIALVGMILLGIFTGPLSEELGWRGYALDYLQSRFSPLLSSLILAPFWWAWHLPLFFMSGTTQHTWGVNSFEFWIFLLQIFPLTILFTWIYNHTDRSILSAVLIHFMTNFTLGLVYPIPARVFLFQALFLLAAALLLELVQPSNTQQQPLIQSRKKG